MEMYLKMADISKMVLTLGKIARIISTVLQMASLLFPINTAKAAA
jgi:hypothetical protein